MKIRMHFGFVIALLSLFGIYSERTITPNQQIVIQFSDEAINEKTTENAIVLVKEQLKSIGITHIQIGKQQKGQLKITYYSDSDVKDIKTILTKKNALKLGYASNKDKKSKSSKEESPKDYKLNISEIQNKSHSNWDCEGILAVEFNHKSDRYYYPEINNSTHITNVELNNYIAKVTLQVDNATIIKGDKKLHETPEVRAGPIV